MIKIKFFSSFCDSLGPIDIWKRLSELKNSKKYGVDYMFTTEDDYTHAIIMCTAMPNLSIPKENVIGIASEPPYFLGLTDKFIQYAQKHISRYLIGQKGSLPSPFEECYGYLWHMTPLYHSLLQNQVKNNLISIMVSQKNHAPGHKYRHALVQQILKTNLPIDIYGRGCAFYQNDSRLKGVFKKTEPYLSYKFHICIENFKTPHYFSEKITNTLLSSTVPIYYGATTIDSYFPNCIIKLTENIQQDILLLQNICKNPQNYMKTIHIEQIKNTIHIERLIDKFTPLKI